MKKFFFLLTVAALAFAACDKFDDLPITNTDDTSTNTDSTATIAGEYDMTVVYDSVCAQGSWFPNGFGGQNYPESHGRMMVADLGGDSIRLTGITAYTTGEDTTYSTTATRNPDGSYTARSSSHQIGTTVYADTYRPITFEGDSVMRFQVVSDFEMYGYNMAFLRTITCTKKN